MASKIIPLLLSVLLFLILIFDVVHSNLTEKQMKATGKLIRNSCQPKHKATDEEIAAMHAGDFSENQNVKCYMQCVMVSMKVAKKNGQPDWKSAYAQLDTLPEPRVAATKASMDKCRETIELQDEKCANSWLLAKCLYEDNPENYFLP